MTMLGLKKALLFSAPLLSSATALRIPNGTEGIQWGPCAHDQGQYRLPVVCGNVSVPLDYTAKNASGSLVLQLTKIPALAGPSKGSILFNFGGPGGEAQQTLAEFAPYAMNVTGGEHDLVAFDPRGTGTTIPFSCYETPLEALAARLQFPDIGANSSDVALGRIWAQGKVKANTCAGAPGNGTGELIGTAFVARDFMAVVDALKEDGKLRYWGISYGTLLGATIAYMFPDRIDRLVLDAVVNPHEHYQGLHEESISDVDELFRAFIKECVGSRGNCPLARNNITAVDLEAKIYDLFFQLKYDPVPLGGFIIDYTIVKVLIFNALYRPGSWPIVASALDNLLTGDLERLQDSPLLTANTTQVTIATDALSGIGCSDSSRRAAKLADLRPEVDRLAARSKLAGDGIAVLSMQCTQWPFVAKERYEGDFTAKTSHPVLLIGNTLDPITPLASAHNMSAGFEGSVVLQHDGYGTWETRANDIQHATTAQTSACSNNAIREYFQTGKLPEPGTVCEVDDKEIFKPANSSATASGPNVVRRRLI